MLLFIKPYSRLKIKPLKLHIDIMLTVLSFIRTYHIYRKNVLLKKRFLVYVQIIDFNTFLRTLSAKLF